MCKPTRFDFGGRDGFVLLNVGSRRERKSWAHDSCFPLTSHISFRLPRSSAAERCPFLRRGLFFAIGVQARLCANLDAS